MSKFTDQAVQNLEIMLRFRVAASADNRQLEHLTFFGDAGAKDSMIRVKSVRPATEQEVELWNHLVKTEATVLAQDEELQLKQQALVEQQKLVAKLAHSEAKTAGSGIVDAYAARDSLGTLKEPPRGRPVRDNPQA